MDDKTAQQLNDKTRTAAFRIVQAMGVFDNEAPEIRHQAEQIIMARVQLMRSGSRDIIDGDNLVKVVDEPKSAPDTP